MLLRLEEQLEREGQQAEEAKGAGPLGLRDRAMLEVLYSTGVRRSELVNLGVYDLDAERGTLAVQGQEGPSGADRGTSGVLGEIVMRSARWRQGYSLACGATSTRQTATWTGRPNTLTGEATGYDYDALGNLKTVVLPQRARKPAH